MAHAVGFTDWDIVNAHPEILLQICKACGLACINLEYYCTHRDELLSKIISATGCDRGRAKNLFLRLLYLGKYQFWLDGDDKDPTIIAHEIFQQKIPEVLIFLNNFENELEKIATLIFENNKEMQRIAIAKAKKDPTLNPLSSVMSYLLQEYEIRVMEIVYSYCKQNGYISEDNVCVLCNDGIMLLEKLITGADLPVEFNNVVMEKTGFNLKFTKKELDQSMLHVLDEHVISKRLFNSYSEWKIDFEKVWCKITLKSVFIGCYGKTGTIYFTENQIVTAFKHLHSRRLNISTLMKPNRMEKSNPFPTLTSGSKIRS